MAKVVTPLVCEVQAIGRPRESKYEAGVYYHPTLFFDLSHPQNSRSQAKSGKTSAVRKLSG